MSRDVESIAPPEVSQSLRDLCQWAILGTIQADAEESINAIDTGYGFIAAAGEVWDTALRDLSPNNGDGPAFNYSSRTLLLANRYARISFKAHAKVMPVSERSPGDAIIKTWRGRSDTPMVYADISSVIADLRVTRPDSCEVRLVAVPNASANDRVSFEVARLRSTAELASTDVGLRKLTRLGHALLETVTVQE